MKKDNLIVRINAVYGTHRQVADRARTTIGLDVGDKEVSDSYMRRLYLCEHSPIRIRKFIWRWINLPYWVSVHFVRHKFGIEHWVSTQRDDRSTSLRQTHMNRGEAPQNAPVSHECEANAQAIINISRKRLCNCASRETREAWLAVLKEIEKVDPMLVSVCVPDCIYRGWCYEHKSCGFHEKPLFQTMLDKYREGINGYEIAETE